MKKRLEINWDEVQVGDIFAEDKSVVVDIFDWEERKCYELTSELGSMIASDTHLFAIRNDDNKKSLLSEEQKAILLEESNNWFSSEDIFNKFNNGEEIYLLNGEKLLNIELFDEGRLQKCRCIQTNTGTYEINGFLSHNSARKLFYGMSDIMVVKDCGGTHESTLSCLLPEGHICEKCAHSTKGGHNVKVGDYVGGLVSTNLSEPLTQLSMKQMHVGSSEAANQQDHAKIIMATYDGWGTSPIVAKAKEAKDYLEARQIISDELKEVYKDAGVAQDPFNIEMIARKMTSYKRVPGVGLVPVKEGEMCTIVGMQSIGNSSNIFKNAELSSGYRILTKPVKQEIKPDAVNPLLV